MPFSSGEEWIGHHEIYLKGVSWQGGRSENRHQFWGAGDHAVHCHGHNMCFVHSRRLAVRLDDVQFKAWAPFVPGFTRLLAIRGFRTGLVWVIACGIYGGALIAWPYNYLSSDYDRLSAANLARWLGLRALVLFSDFCHERSLTSSAFDMTS
jgi:hypothetical protein